MMRFLGLGLAFVMTSIAYVAFGSVSLPISDVFGALTGGTVDPGSAAIVQIRTDRWILGVVTGAALSVSGVVLQGILRNPLADPYILGTSSGAALGATMAMVLGLSSGLLGAIAPPVCAFAGALGATALVYAIARVDGVVPRERLLLAGVIVGLFLGAVIMLLMTLSREMLHGVVAMLMGSLDHPFTHGSRRVFLWSCPLLFGMAGFAFFHARDLDALALGEESAAAVGVDTTRVRTSLFIASSILVGGVVAFTGLIGFVGLVVPHVVRMAFGPFHGRLIPLSAVSGAILLLGSDLFARTITESPLPVGVVTALLGGPFFLYLLLARPEYSR